MKLGDTFARIVYVFGISPCESCKARKEALNLVDTEQAPLLVARDVAVAVLDPTMFTWSMRHKELSKAVTSAVPQKMTDVMKEVGWRRKQQ